MQDGCESEHVLLNDGIWMEFVHESDREVRRGCFAFAIV